MTRLVQVKPVGPANSTTEHGGLGPKQALN